MTLFAVALMACLLFAAGYLVYGRWLAQWLDLSSERVTPAYRLNDGVDYVPAKGPFLLGQHFSAIAAAGPIVGPILAGLWFGWVPALAWIVLALGTMRLVRALAGARAAAWSPLLLLLLPFAQLILVRWGLVGQTWGLALAPWVLHAALGLVAPRLVK